MMMNSLVVRFTLKYVVAIPEVVPEGKETGGDELSDRHLNADAL
jgi:hypothetical protein